jgi:DNA repair protein RadC
MTIVSTRPRRPAARSRVTAREALPAYGVSDGILSFRYGLHASERRAVDQALAILGKGLRERDVFASPDAVKNYLQLQLAGEGRELFGAIYVDSQNRAIAFENHFIGSLTETSVYPREVVTAALRHGAAAVIFSHNHPSGTVQPSRADEALTQTLKDALALVGVRVLDHVIVAPGRALSLAERGLI